MPLNDQPPFFTRDEDELNRLVSRVDPALEFVADLHPSTTSCRTLLVNDSDTRRVLKVKPPSGNAWDDTYFQLETLALKRVEERNVERVTRLVRGYRNEHYEAILKTFATGTPGDLAITESMLHSRDFVDRLDDLYLRLHLAGIAKINFLPRKVVVAPDGGLILLDLSTCIVDTEYGFHRFVREMRRDSRFINRLERQVTH